MNFIPEKYWKWVWSAIFIVVAVLCFTVVYDIYSNHEFVKYAIGYLDNKANTVLALTGAATSASLAITLIPGDVGTPIATELANISSYSIVVLAAVHLEKYLLTLASLISLKVLLPGSMVLASLNMSIFNNRTIKSLVRKVSTFALAFVLIVPISVSLSNLIEKTYQDDVSIKIEETQQTADEIKESIEGKDQSTWDKIISTVTGGTTEAISKFEDSLNNFVEAISVMLITACAIPVLTFVVLMWLIKAILQIDIPIPGRFETLSGKFKLVKNNEEETQ